MKRSKTANRLARMLAIIFAFVSIMAMSAGCGGGGGSDSAGDESPAPADASAGEQEQEVYWDDEGVGWNQPIDPEPEEAPDPNTVLELQPDGGYPLDNDEIYICTYGLVTQDRGWDFFGQVFDTGSRGFEYEDTPGRIVAENLVINGTEEVGNVDLGISEDNAWNFYIDFAPLAGYEPITSLETTLRVYWEGREFETYRFIIAYNG